MYEVELFLTGVGIGIIVGVLLTMRHARQSAHNIVRSSLKSKKGKQVQAKKLDGEE